jgi:hypothetical protein
METHQWNQLIDADEDVLFIRLGAQLSGLSARSGEEGDQLEIGKHWWSAHLDALRNLVCTSESVKSFSKGKHWDRVTAGTAIFDLLLVHYTTALSTTITALVLRQGLLEFCDCVWNQEGTI